MLVGRYIQNIRSFKMRTKFLNPFNKQAITALSLVVCFSWASMATTPPQNSKDQTQQVEATNTPESDIEVIGVVGERSVFYFKSQMDKAELDFYDAFNSLADDEKFVVKCRSKKRMASNISQKICNPQIVIDRMAKETQDALRSGLPTPGFEALQLAAKSAREESMAYVEKVVIANPSLLKKLIELNKKQKQYQQAKQSE